MKSLVAIAFLIFVVTEAHHTPEHTLRGPRFAIGKVQVYDVELNVTASIPGLDNQVSKTAFKCELHVYAKDEKEHILKVTKVYTSGSVKAVEGKDADVHMQKNRELESRLSIPIKFTLENGEVTSYTLSPRESLESKKIKKAILRSLEMHVPQVALQQMESSKPSLRIPVVYNLTRNEAWGQQTARYMITVSPDVEFPYSNMVYNISRFEKFERNSYHIHHNFKQENCGSTCDEQTSSEQEGECESECESDQIPIKSYVRHTHDLVLEEGVMTPEIIRTVEVHDAKMYDQDMKVLIRQKIRKIGYSRNIIDEPTEQVTHTDLQDQEIEIDEDEISHKCEDPVEALEAVKRLMREIAEIIVQGDLQNKESTIVGEKIILLKRALSKFKVSDFQLLSREIIPKESLKTAQEDEKVKRQIWMDVLPLVGSSESVYFIASYIKENVDKDLLIWEAKEMLEALPSNIQMPDERMLTELRALLSLPEVRKSHFFHSAVHSCLARVIRSLCSGSEIQPSNSHPAQRSMFYRNLQQTSSSRAQSRPECPTQLAYEILQDTIHKLAATRKQDEIIIYLDTLTQIGASEVFPVIAEYAYGTAENIQDFSPSYIEFVKSAAIYALHNVADRYPEDVLEIVMPIFFNQTEYPKIRTAAFGVLIRSHPSLEVLQHVASHSWTERSNEVGSYVTSAMHTFGNASLPCMQLTADRIKQVMPLLKRFDIGAQHAKNFYRTYFDDIRMFGLKGRFTYMPSNVSDFPSAIYHSLSYTSGPLVDTLLEGALNIQGSEDDIWGRVIGYMFGFEIPSKETIPESKEREIFKESKIAERIPESIRLTLYKRLFYSKSFYYLDSSNMKTQVNTLREYLTTYLETPSSKYSGHLVKLMLPSSLHTLTVARSLPYPVEFQMDHPVVLALKMEPKERSAEGFHYLVRPSVYISKLLTHQIKNLGDCKEVGVYHEHKLAISYPVEIKFQARSLLDATIQYKLPQLPKKILYYFTESGTYADRKELEKLPSSKDREPIRMLPSPLRNSTTVNLVGLPPIHVECHTEEIGLLTEDSPSNPWEVVDFAVKKILNAGWRYKSANISLQEDSQTWPQDTEVTFTVHHSRTHFTKENQRMSRHQHSPTWPGDRNIQRSKGWMSRDQNDEGYTTETPSQKWWWDRSGRNDYSDDKWTEELKPDDISRNRNPSTFIDQAKKISSIISSSLPHMTHVFNFNVETRPVHSFANLRAEFNHTYSASLQAYHLDVAMKLPSERTAKQFSFDHVIGVSRKPDEFQYNTYQDDHSAVFVTGLRARNVGCSCPWKDVEVVAKGEFKYETLDSILNEELENSVERKFYLPEDHDQCLEDVRNGHSQSSSCMKAIKERSSFNKLGVSILWNSNPSETLKNLGRRLEMFVKHTFYDHMSVDYHPNSENKIQISLNHIEKFTQKPLFDVMIKKPEETISLRRIKAFALPLNSVYDVISLDSMSFSNNTYPPTCVMMEKSVRTYDLKYYPLSVDECSYVLSAHCTKDKNFAIITKILSSDGKKEVHVHVGPHTLVMSPMSGSHYTIKYDDQDYVISEPHVFDEQTSDIYVYSDKYESEHRHLEVMAKKAGVRILYDGKNVKVEVDPKYKGQTCGLCSEFDGETFREFRGMDRCLYSHPADFVNSAIISQGSCKKEAVHPHICEGTTMAWLRGSNPSTYAPSVRRNIVKANGNDICFSVRPVPVCDEDSEPSETEVFQIGFHCLPKQDITAKRMVSEAKRRSLGEIENKSIDYQEDIEVAKMC